jgi:hypothetical protein
VDLREERASQRTHRGARKVASQQAFQTIRCSRWLVLNTSRRRIDRKGPFPVPLWWLSHHIHPAARYSRDLCSEKFHLTPVS